MKWRFFFRYARVVGKYLIMQIYLYGHQNQQHLYYADLEKNGEIKGKITLKPVYTADANTKFVVNMTIPYELEQFLY